MNKSEAIRILCMEDDPGAARLIQKTLNRAGYAVNIAHDGQKGLDMYDAGAYALLMVDQSMPVLEGLDVLRKLAARQSTAPVVMITGHGDERLAVEAMKLGARDYIVKDVSGGFLELLPTVVRRVLQQQQLLEEKRQAEAALKESEERLDSILKSVPDIIYRLDAQGRITFISDAVIPYGYWPGDLLSRNILELVHPDDRAKAAQRINDKRRVNRDADDLEIRFLTGGNGPISSELERIFLVRAQGIYRLYSNKPTNVRTFIGTQGIAKDITERKRAEAEQEKLLKELKKALADVKILSGLIPICASCKKIRDDKGYWNQIETYIRDHSDAQFTHGICPQCAQKLYGDFVKPGPPKGTHSGS
ncbi:response regulator [uncultured Desulfosarcina sp.]|uniref:PAS domain-containing response regulator n=1 Tax=uncultured Desulfosarcina sp. TaxID=218289 RepID=UPI0029C8D056|nr:response regulator [uncultured Desulfosarcina sp.]